MVPARSTWMTEWHRVVFSDESRFCLSSDSRRVRVWRRRGERSNPAAIVERPTVRQRGIMVWGAIAYDSRSPLLRIQGTMTAQRYENARPHTARISQQALQDVQMLPWPPYSPDLSPIEHIWDIIGRRLHALPQPRSEDELWQMVEREWRAIPQDAIRTLIDSLPRRVAACTAVRSVLDRLRFLPIKKMDQRTCIKFCVKNEIKCADAFRMLTVAYGEATLDRSNVYRWYKMFSEGREDVNDEERAGHPSTSTTDEKINEQEKMILGQSSNHR
ncbi:hypothetical protein LAZ67_15002543 [Cordylochernes scorpioides]|uniref:Transposase n=1 Tax=Cordylochernes scorpioides TaxID=51811 RepID=A0ABY6LAU2_9ARAC|nr:hypothetical protein LAZ67_15002543 [Cordylochernes scorpioides]